VDYGENFYKMANEMFAQHPRFKGKGPGSALGGQQRCGVLSPANCPEKTQDTVRERMHFFNTMREAE